MKRKHAISAREAAELADQLSAAIGEFTRTFAHSFLKRTLPIQRRLAEAGAPVRVKRKRPSRRR